MKMSPAVRRPVVAAASAAAVVAMLAGCSNSDDDATTASSSPVTASESDSSSAPSSADGLTKDDAQKTLRTALSEETSTDDLKGLVDDSVPGTVQALAAYNKVAAKAGYTPDIYTVKSVEVSGDKATAKVAIASPHTSKPIEMPFGFVKQGDDWKLSADAVTTLTEMNKQHGS
ncbi:hypothetical protein [Gordonia shandongensis]|uniref:hypothetical protein n=1 Tax=Gordonia shandongensis TaxID=376351 RepID=UPI0003F8BED4|nr:hypothetical protein [Gordonia shandongensis]